MSMQSLEVPPLSRKQLFDSAALVRRQLRVTEDYLPIVQILELVLPKIIPEYFFDVLQREEMGPNHGLTVPSENAIYLRQDVYDNAVDGQGRDRFTAAHELGHYLHHKDVPIKFHRSATPLKAFRDSEWQANTFAAALLMPPERMALCKSLSEVADRFGVSLQAAATQNRVLHNMRVMGILN